MPDRYIYRREDNGTTVEVGFDEMMQQVGGFITLSDGVLARRCVYLEQDGKPLQASAPKSAVPPKIVSDTLGCGMHQVEQLREHARTNGFNGVEFTPDPDIPQFYQARISSVSEWRRYMKSRGLGDKNSRNGSGAILSASALERATARLLEQANETQPASWNTPQSQPQIKR